MYSFAYFHKYIFIQQHVNQILKYLRMWTVTIYTSIAIHFIINNIHNVCLLNVYVQYLFDNWMNITSNISLCNILKLFYIWLIDHHAVTWQFVKFDIVWLKLVLTWFHFHFHFSFWCNKTITVFCIGQYEFLWTLEINIQLSLMASVNIVFKIHQNSYWPQQKTIIV